MLHSSFNSYALSSFIPEKKLHLPWFICGIQCLFLCICLYVRARLLVELDSICPCCSHHPLPTPRTVNLARRRATPSLSRKHLFLFNKPCPTETSSHAPSALIGWAQQGAMWRERERERAFEGEKDRLVSEPWRDRVANESENAFLPVP